MSISRDELVDAADKLLDVRSFRDYGPNGLQVEGRSRVERIVTGVTACQRLIDAAIELGADALIVHHGLFWKGDSPVLTGMLRRRVASLLAHDLSLLAYHLPLDCHATLGNNACLAGPIGAVDMRAHLAGDIDGLLWTGRLSRPRTIDRFRADLEAALGRAVLIVDGRPDTDLPLREVGWCSGGGQRLLRNAAALGVDLFLSGEISEQTTHEAREHGLAYVAAGHHATECDGVRALGTELARRFDLEHHFVEIENPA